MRYSLLVALVFLGVAIGLSGVLPLWLDEIIQLTKTRGASAAEVIAAVKLDAGATPLGYIVQQESLRLTGYSARRARLPSALFGTAAVFTVALLAAELGLEFPWMAAALFAAFPLTLRYAAESRIYAQALFFSVLATLIYVRFARKPSWLVAVCYCLALVLTLYTLPYAAFVGLALVVWSLACRAYRTAFIGAAALGIAALVFLPWYVSAKRVWVSDITGAGIHFSYSAKTPLMLFRELAGAGYWGSGLLLILCILALRGPRLPSRPQVLLISLIAAPLIIGVGLDAAFDYFLASRQFMWVLPAVAILATLAAERTTRAGVVLCALLALVCIWQDIRFFTAPRENWELAAQRLAAEVTDGTCVMIAPSDHAALYEFFKPQLRERKCEGPRVVLATSPYATNEQRRAAASALNARGYVRRNETMVGKFEADLYAR
jgi:4-amino-4-deoxy-L-arabinose transferase-like glycosyltransferase